MKGTKKSFVKNLRYLLLVSIVAVGLIAIVASNGTDESTTTTKHCPDSDYPLWCPTVGVCCTVGHPYYCDGLCYEQRPSGCAQYDT